MGNNDLDEEVVEKRKEVIFDFVKKKINWIAYIILALLVYLGVFIRTRNIPGLKDISTGTWTLGPDLDPFLFLRWAEYIVENGKLMAIDMMRYVPLGYSTAGELRLVPYGIAWLYKFLAVFSNEITVTYAAIIFPVVMFSLTIIAFFFFVREIFIGNFNDKKFPNIIALIASFFLTVLPVLLPRTIAGIPEKESAAFFFMFTALYFFLLSWRIKEKRYILFAILSGIATAAMANTWGGYGYIFLIIGLSNLISFLLGKISIRKIYVYIIWVASSLALMMPFSTKFTISRIISSTTVAPALAVLGIILIHFILYNTKLKEVKYFKEGIFSKMPSQVNSLIIGGVLMLILATILNGVNFIPGQVNSLFSSLVKPATSRLIQTVAENRQPYFTEWAGNFGPIINNIPIFFTLFFVGSVYLFAKMIKPVKEKWILITGYIIFLSSIVFSRYSGSSILNGENTISLFIYFTGTLLFLCIIGYSYLKIVNQKENEKLESIEFGNIMLLCFFALSIISARGLVRLIMILVPPASAIVAFLIVGVSKDVFYKEKDDILKVFGWIILLIVLSSAVYSGFYFYQSILSQAESYYPSQYNWQWQLAMDWVRDNTQSNAVFGHWWDYGYWIQSIGERATILDGGNSISYWNYLMGREVLTTPDDRTALEFLYAHNATHYLIDSTDIGKYAAYSKIGSDVNYDRMTYIPTITVNEKESRETNEGIIYIYNGGFGLDEDIFININGEQKTFIKENTGIAGIIIEKKNNEFQQPIAVFVSNGASTNIALRYLYDNGKLTDFGSGVESGVFLIDYMSQSGGNLQKIENGAGFYLSKKTLSSFLARKYLFGEEGNFKLVHNEPNYIIDNLRKQNLEIEDFAYFQNQFLGPIRIWEIQYPSDITFKEEYIHTDYPEELKFS